MRDVKVKGVNRVPPPPHLHDKVYFTTPQTWSPEHRDKEGSMMKMWKAAPAVCTLAALVHPSFLFPPHRTAAAINRLEALHGAATKPICCQFLLQMYSSEHIFSVRETSTSITFGI